MGYDFHMPGNPETWINYTYNVSPMFYAANPGKGILVINGMTGERAVQPLLNIRTYMISHRSEMEAMNPENGWGNYSGAINLLDRLIEASRENPDGKWEAD